VLQMTPNSSNYFLHEISFMNYYLSQLFTFITRFLQVTSLYTHHVKVPSTLTPRNTLPLPHTYLAPVNDHVTWLSMQFSSTTTQL
jgi:hypothetical protein